MKFDVHGRTLIVQREGERWAVYQSADGRRSLAPDIVIPGSLEATEVSQYLADLFHELATPQHPNVRCLD